jgi:hypothetical protein
MALWFAAHTACHPDVDLERTVIVHIAEKARRAELLGEYQAAHDAEV